MGPRYINRWMVGFKFGNFAINRKIAKFKAKQLKKKKNKVWTYITDILD